MSIRELPRLTAPSRPQNFQWDAPSDVFSRWADMAPLAASGAARTIDIFDVIGEDWWSGGGYTDVAMAKALRDFGPGDVTVNLNSPGGDMWQGIAIYNMLAQHPGKVSVQVMGLAASAASIIAMAGDTIAMGTGSQMMIHNAWGVVIGNQNDLRSAAETFAGFDASLADIYEARTGNKRADIVAAMDAETFMDAQTAVQLGYADAVGSFDQAAASAQSRMDPALMARRRTEAALAKSGFSRSDRQQMIAALGGAQRDASSTVPPARDASDLTEGLRALINTLN